MSTCVMTTKKLKSMKPSCRRVFLHLLRNGPTPLYILQRPDIGGTSADRRIRELKERYGIEYDWEYSRKKGSKMTIYWLVVEPVQLEMAM